MLIGKENSVNEKLLTEINRIMPVCFVEIEVLLDKRTESLECNPKIIFVNLMDVGADEKKLLKKLKCIFPNAKLLGIHCYMVPSMIDQTLEKGYDAYLPIFEFSENLEAIIQSLTTKER